ncbi:MAG TPA: EamA family transporter [Chitinophagaceae bacterium]|nr:EamA family transporter [Chitinophagaceae bacterium]
MIDKTINTIVTHKFSPFKGTRGKAYLALAFICFFWGTTWLASKQGVIYVHPLQLAGIRQFVGGILYILFFLNQGFSFPKGKDWLPIITMSLLNFILSNGLSTWGVKYISAGLGSIIGAIIPLWIVLIGLFSKNEKIKTKAVIGLLLGFGGICVIFFEHLLDFLNADFRFGIFLSLTASLAWAWGSIYTKKQAKNFNPYFGVGLQMLMSGLVMYSISGFTGLSVPLSSIPWQGWAAIAYLILFGSILSFIAYIYALQHLPTSQASIYAYINPIVAVVLGAMLFDEKLTSFIVVGGAITLYGVYLVNNSYSKKE